MTPPKGASAYVAALKIPVTILCLFGTVLAAYYFFYVTLHRTYLIERNFRLLATLGEAIVVSLENDKRVIENLAHDNYERSSRLFDPGSRRDRAPKIRRRAANFIPFLRSAEVVGADWDGYNQTFALQLVEPESRLVWMRTQRRTGKRAAEWSGSNWGACWIRCCATRRGKGSSTRC